MGKVMGSTESSCCIHQALSTLEQHREWLQHCQRSPCPATWAARLLRIRAPLSDIHLVFQSEMRGREHRGLQKWHKQAKQKKCRSRPSSRRQCWNGPQASLWEQVTKGHLCFGVDMQEEHEAWVRAAPHAWPSTVSDIVQQEDSGIRGKVFWVLANEVIAEEDIRCNRMFF